MTRHFLPWCVEGKNLLLLYGKRELKHRAAETAKNSLDKLDGLDCPIGEHARHDMYPASTEIEDLYRQHGPALLLFAIAMTRERSSAQDAVQQVFVRLLERGLGDVVHAKAYLYRCVRNAVLNSAKAQERNVALDEDTPWFDVLNRDFAEELSLRHGLRALPSEQRQVVVLRVWCGLTYAETASLLEISANTVASRYRYALEKLRDAMGAREDSCADARR